MQGEDIPVSRYRKELLMELLRQPVKSLFGFHSHYPNWSTHSLTGSPGLFRSGTWPPVSRRTLVQFALELEARCKSASASDSFEYERLPHWLQAMCA